MKKYIFTLLILLLSLFFFGYQFYSGQIRCNYPDKNEFPVRGIDISHHQGTIDWKNLSTEDISFVYIKATEGKDFKDPMFSTNWSNSKKNGYKTGAYHFYLFCRNGKEQAANFINSVPNDPDSLPPVIDLELGGNCGSEKSQARKLAEVTDFLKRIESYYKKRPIIYATMDFYDKYLIHNFTDYPIWIRSIYHKPKLKDNRKWLIWQFANRGHCNGITSYVDINVINGMSIDNITHFDVSPIQ